MRLGRLVHAGQLLPQALGGALGVQRRGIHDGHLRIQRKDTFTAHVLVQLQGSGTVWQKH